MHGYSYSAAGDMTAFLLCIVLLLSLKATYTQKSRRYKFVIIALFNLMYVSTLSIIYHFYIYPNIADINDVFVYLTHNSLYISLIFQLGLYVFYIFDLINYWHKPSNLMMIFLFGIFVILESTSSFTKIGFCIKNDVAYDNAHDNIYLIWYVLHLIIMVSIVLMKNKVIIRKIYISIVLTMGISFFITLSEFFYNTETFTVVSYYIPILSVAFLFHCTSYNSNFGAVDRTALVTKVSSLIHSKKDFIFVNIVIPDFSKIENLPQTIEDFKAFSLAVHYKDYLFRYDEDSFVMIFGKNSNYAKIEEIFAGLHERYHMSHHITIIEANRYCHTLNDYIHLCKVYENIKPVYKVTDADLIKFNKTNIIQKELDDIENKGDLNDSRVKVYCQPILDVGTKTFTTAESLMRLELDELGFIYPDVFIPIAEANGKIHALTKIILNKVCQYIEQHPDVNRISVNFSMYEISKPFFYEDIINIIMNYSFDKRKLGFEVTESIDADDFDLIREVLTKFRSLGISIYLDDFGTGYSNIEHIAQLPIDIIKFDRSLVMSSRQNPTSMEIVSNLSNMFNIIGYRILYEGIEDGNDQKLCVKLKAQYLQGFMYSKPIPIEQLVNFIGKKSEAQITMP